MHKKSIGFCVIASMFIGLSFLIFGCSPTSVAPIIPLKDGEISVDISGFGSFYATNSVSDSTSALFHVHASMLNKDNSDSLVIDLLATRGNSIPFSVDVSTDANSKIAYCIIKPDGSCTNYSADMINGGSGQIRISSITPTLQGTFSGTLQLIGGSGSVTISNGEFNSGYH